MKNTIKYSNLWNSFEVLKLKRNVRSNNENFSSLLLQIGEGKITNFVIPKNWITHDVCESIYGGIDKKFWMNRIILSSHNEDTKIINERVLKLIPSEQKSYYSIDFATHKGVDQTDDNIYLDYPIEFLNSITEGLPPHELNLKIHAIVMLVRNLSVSNGLCNGTRLKIINLYNHNIEAEIITGENIGQRVFIPRITLSTTECSSLPFILYRKQFPLVLAFSMTINKSQGQSFDAVYFCEEIFFHMDSYT